MMLFLQRMKVIGLSLSLVLTIISCSSPPRPIVKEVMSMNTFLTVSVYDEGLKNSQIEAWVDSAIREIARIEQYATNYSDASDIGRLNSNAGIDSVVVSDEILHLLEKSIAYSKESDGAFDITVEPLVKAWDFMSDNPSVPSDKAIKGLIQRVGFPKLIVGRKAYLTERGMGVDLGAIAKGYAVDRALEVLRRGGIKNCIVDLGGNLGVYWEGTRLFDSTIAAISIRHPRIDGEFFGEFKVGSAGISTSGDYQRFFIKEGARYHHILNPKTGFPANDLVSVTIIADNAMKADALSTLVFVLGREEGFAKIKKDPDVEALFVYESGDTLAMVATSRMNAALKRVQRE